MRSNALIGYMLIVAGGILILAGARDNPPFLVLRSLLENGKLPAVGEKSLTPTQAKGVGAQALTAGLSVTAPQKKARP